MNETSMVMFGVGTEEGRDIEGRGHSYMKNGCFESEEATFEGELR